MGSVYGGIFLCGGVGGLGGGWGRKRQKTSRVGRGVESWKIDGERGGGGGGRKKTRNSPRGASRQHT